jgi:micrococcal nuclease
MQKHSNNPRRCSRFWGVIALCRYVFFTAAACIVFSVPASASNAQPRFELCSPGNFKTCVVDGDTVRINFRRIRLSGIDAPETHPSRCAAEKELGDRATRRLLEILNAGRWVETTHGRDIYGRTLATFAVGSADVGAMLVKEGLARLYLNHREPWC